MQDKQSDKDVFPYQMEKTSEAVQVKQCMHYVRQINELFIQKLKGCHSGKFL